MSSLEFMPTEISATAGEPPLDPKRRWWRVDLRIPSGGAVVGSLASVGVTQLALIVTGVVTARTLGPADRGYLALVILVPTVLHIVGALGLPRAATYYIASDPPNGSSVLHAIRAPAVLQAVILTVLQVAIFSVLLTDDPVNVRWAGVVVLPLAAANLADMYGKAILQGQQRFTAFNILRNATVTFNLFAVLLVLAIGQTNLVGFAVAFVVASILSAVVTVTVALTGRRSRTKPTVNIQSRKVLGYGLRGYLVSLSPIGTFRLDQAIIGLFLAPRALGIYVVAIAFTNFPTFVSRSVGLVAFPHVAGASRTREDEMRQFLWFSIALSGAAALVLELASGWLVPFFFGQEFAEAIPLTRILLLGAFLDGVRRVLTDTSSGIGRPGLGSIAEVASWVVLVPALVLLMPPWGITGVAAATAVSSAASLLTLVLLVRHSTERSDRVRQSR